MSLLDDNFDTDIIHNIVLNYLKKIYIYRTIDLQDGYYCFPDNTTESQKIEYNNKPEDWYIMYKYNTRKFYITKWVTGYNRYKHDLCVVKFSKNNDCNLKYLLDEFIG